MPQEDEVTSYVSSTSGSANSAFDSEQSENDLVEKVQPDDHVEVKPKVQTVKVQPQLPKGFKKVQFVKARNMQQEVSKIEKISDMP
ncbi:hypothetical protein L1987_74347 [Smallanthus sonchifolius]|uniref:Uncharacterized protein n=1 Tax=Smallanthus sonchifolius TaxID=185202 RepID=A0ACB9A402_9ASTR|nr:hypothetical protein L1987_74347 [Smallanthus sonchifolius]